MTTGNPIENEPIPTWPFWVVDGLLCLVIGALVVVIAYVAGVI